MAVDSIQARTGGEVLIEDSTVVVRYEDREEREYVIPPSARLKVENGQRVSAGDQITEGTKNPQDILRIQGREAVQMYLVDEVQKVYRSQGVNINDKHIEVIVRQMLRRVRIDTPGDTGFLPGELVDRFRLRGHQRGGVAEGGEPATAQPVLLGVTKATLNTDSFLAAASFQETTRVLTEAAINGATDRLVRPEGERDHRQADPRGHGLQGAARAGGRLWLPPRPPRPRHWKSPSRQIWLPRRWRR